MTSKLFEEKVRSYFESKLAEFESSADDGNDGNNDNDSNDRGNNELVYSTDEKNLKHAASLVDSSGSRYSRAYREILIEIWSKFPPELYVQCVLAITPKKWAQLSPTTLLTSMMRWSKGVRLPRLYVKYVRTVTGMNGLLPKAVQATVKYGTALSLPSILRC